MKKILMFFIYFLFFHNISYSQNSALRGVLIDSKKNIPIENARLSILGVDNTFSNSAGEFILNLEFCENCEPGDQILIDIDHNEYGFQQKIITISKGFKIKISLGVDNLVSIAGTVHDESGRIFLEGIKVSILIPGSIATDYPIAITNEFGVYSFKVNQETLGSITSLELLFKDDSKNYFSKKLSRSISDVNIFDVFLEPIDQSLNEVVKDNNKLKQLEDRINQLELESVEPELDNKIQVNIISTKNNPNYKSYSQKNHNAFFESSCPTIDENKIKISFNFLESINIKDIGVIFVYIGRTNTVNGQLIGETFFSQYYVPQSGQNLINISNDFPKGKLEIRYGFFLKEQLEKPSGEFYAKSCFYTKK